MNILDFYQRKNTGEKISIMTCYDYPSAHIAARTSLDCLLVGDTVAMTVHGFKDTLAATLEMMCMHTAAVSRGAENKWIISDLPFLSYRKSLSRGVSAAQALMQAGAHSLKLEGAPGNLKFIQHLTESGVPVMGHLGLTPQFVHSLGGYKVQGKGIEAANQIKEHAIALQEAGCFAVVLECIPPLLTKEVTALLSIPTIGIGAGPFSDGQVLVFHDMLGLTMNFNLKFVKTYLNGYEQFTTAIEAYANEVKRGEFPQDAHCYNN
jgi:3-methyl-2-oxobutanoate hydroxymethyltransferase